MRRFIFPLSVISLFVLGFVASCDKFEQIRKERDNTLDSFEFGYYEDMRSGMAKVADFLSFKQGEKTFYSFMSEEDLDDLRSGKGSEFLNPDNNEMKELMDTSNYRESSYEYKEYTEFAVMTAPFNAPVFDVEIVNHTPEILSFEKHPTDNKLVKVHMNHIGLARFDVTVTGLGFKKTKSFKVRVIATVKAKFIITNRQVARSQLGSRIWCTFTNVPKEAFPLMISITDSVAISSYGEYYNFSKFGRTMKIYTEQATVPTEERLCLPFWGETFLVRDITKEFRELQGIHWWFWWPIPWTGTFYQPSPRPIYPMDGVYRGIWGELFEANEDGSKGWMPYYYPIYVSNTKLFWTIYCDNPFIEFEGSTFSFWSKDRSEYHLTEDAPMDSLAVMDTIPSGVTSLMYDNIEGFVEETDVAYFDLQIARILSNRAKDSISNALDQWKTRLGFDKVVDEGNFAKRDSLLKEANKGNTDLNM